MISKQISYICWRGGAFCHILTRMENASFSHSFQCGNICKKHCTFVSFTDLPWSKFGSLPLRSKSRINKANKSISILETENTPKHIDVIQWLKYIDLERYSDIFKKFEGVESLLEFSEADLKDLGVKISSHRATMISNLTILRAKYHGKYSVYFLNIKNAKY